MQELVNHQLDLLMKLDSKVKNHLSGSGDSLSLEVMVLLTNNHNSIHLSLQQAADETEKVKHLTEHSFIAAETKLFEYESYKSLSEIIKGKEKTSETDIDLLRILDANDDEALEQAEKHFMMKLQNELKEARNAKFELDRLDLERKKKEREMQTLVMSEENFPKMLSKLDFLFNEELRTIDREKTDTFIFSEQKMFNTLPVSLKGAYSSVEAAVHTFLPNNKSIKIIQNTTEGNKGTLASIQVTLQKDQTSFSIELTGVKDKNTIELRFFNEEKRNVCDFLLPKAFADIREKLVYLFEVNKENLLILIEELHLNLTFKKNFDNNLNELLRTKSTGKFTFEKFKIDESSERTSNGEGGAVLQHTAGNSASSLYDSNTLCFISDPKNQYSIVRFVPRPTLMERNVGPESQIQKAISFKVDNIRGVIHILGNFEAGVYFKIYLLNSRKNSTPTDKHKSSVLYIDAKTDLKTPRPTLAYKLKEARTQKLLSGYKHHEKPLSFYIDTMLSQLN